MSDIKTSWYSTEPSIGDTLMFTTGDTDELGYNVTLDEYADQMAFLPFSELSSKKIRKNPSSFLKPDSKHCAIVTDIDNGQIYISLKDVGNQQMVNHTKLYALNNKMFGLCRRLSHFEHTMDDWHNVLRSAMEDSLANDTPHPYTVITDRMLLGDISGFMPTCYIQTILCNHASLFGMKPCTMEMKFTLVTFAPNGAELTVNEIKGIVGKIKSSQGEGCEGCDDYTDTMLYHDQNKFNFSVNPIALPIFRFTVTAYQRSKCIEVLQSLERLLGSSKFDIARVQV